MVRSIFVLLAVAVSVNAGGVPAQPKPDPAIETLIDRLQALDTSSESWATGVMGRSNASFLAFAETRERPRWYFRAFPKPEDALRELVRRGLSAIPALLNHLDDNRPTRAFYTYSDPGRDLNLYTDEPLVAAPGGIQRHYICVGDVCYAALGHIVNRDHGLWESGRLKGRSANTMRCASKRKDLRDAARAEWGGLNARCHRDSLVRDFLANPSYNDSASYDRLAWYYPEELDALVVARLREPAYSAEMVNVFLATELYRVRPAAERRAAVEAFIQKHGAPGRSGLLGELFRDLARQEYAERHPFDALTGRLLLARESLIDAFGLPATVKSTDGQTEKSFRTTRELSWMIHTLHHDDQPAIDRAVLDLLATTEDDQLALACAVRLAGRGHDSALRAYLERRREAMKEPEWENHRKDVERQIGWTPLHAAVRSHRAEQVEAALAQGADLNARTADGQTPLQFAAAQYNLQIMGLLLDAGADASLDDPQDVMKNAARSDQAGVVRMLAWHGAKPRDAFSAILAGDAAALSAWRDDPNEPHNCINYAGLTTMHLAAREGNLEAMEILAGGANPAAIDSEQNRYKRRPLHYAVLYGHAEIAGWLLDRGADPNARDNRAFTPLHLAAASGQVDMVKRLLASKADPKLVNQSRQTALRLATLGCHDELYDLLAVPTDAE